MSIMNMPLGIYMARAIAGTEQYAPTKNGEPQIAIDLQIEGGEFEGTIVTTVFPFSGKAPEWSIKKLRILGWTGDDLDNLAGIDANAVECELKEEIYDGKTRRKLEVSLGGGGKMKFNETMNPQQKRAFAAQFKGLAKSVPPAGGGAAPAGNGGGRPAF